MLADGLRWLVDKLDPPQLDQGDEDAPIPPPNPMTDETEAFLRQHAPSTMIPPPIKPAPQYLAGSARRRYADAARRS
jgi:hypothetical protein